MNIIAWSKHRFNISRNCFENRVLFVSRTNPVRVSSNEQNVGSVGAGFDGTDPKVELLVPLFRRLGEPENEQVESVLGEKQLVRVAVHSLSSEIPRRKRHLFALVERN